MLLPEVHKDLVHDRKDPQLKLDKRLIKLLFGALYFTESNKI